LGKRWRNMNGEQGPPSKALQRAQPRGAADTNVKRLTRSGTSGT